MLSNNDFFTTKAIKSQAIITEVLEANLRTAHNTSLARSSRGF